MIREGRDHVVAAGCTGFWAAWIFILLAVLAVAALYLQPTLLDLERENIQHSRQYITTQRSALMRYYHEYGELDVQISQLDSESQAGQITAMQSQQRRLLLEMDELASTIPADEVPNDVAALLREKGY